jgi:hypothetical protein
LQKTIIHIGPHKTGSSYLQACFRQYREPLRARGVVVPAEWESPGNAAQTVLVAALRDGGNYEAALETMAKIRTGGAHTLLISAEDLCTLGTVPVQRLRDLLGDSEVTIVYYVRRTSDLLFSSWQEDVKHGTSMVFPEYVLHHVRNPEASLFFNVEVRLKPFIEVFGKDALRLVSYSALRDNKIDLFKHFAQHLLDWQNIEPEPQSREINIAATARQIELLRSLNQIEKLKNPEGARNLRAKLDAALLHLDLTTLFADMAACRKIFVFSDAFPMFARFHRDQRQAYAANVVPPCPAEFLFKLARKEIPYISGDYMLRPGVLEALHEIHGGLVGEGRPGALPLDPAGG